MRSREVACTSDRRMHLKHRLHLERCSGERRRRHFERTKRMMATELATIIQNHVAMVNKASHQKRDKQQRRSKRSKRQRRPASDSKSRSAEVDRKRSSVESKKLIAERDKPFVAWSPNGPPKTPFSRDMVALQRQKSCKMTRDIFQRPGPFVAWRLKEGEKGSKSMQGRARKHINTGND